MEGEESGRVPSQNIRNVSRVPIDSGYEVTLVINKSFLSGGGLKHQAHAIVEIDGEAIFRTRDQPSPSTWNETFRFYFYDLQPSLPSTILLSVHKKRWTSSGYKLVGTHNIPLSDLLTIVDKNLTDNKDNSNQLDVDLIPNKRNLTLHGNLIFSISVKSIASDKEGSKATNAPSRQLLMKRQKSLSSVDRVQHPLNENNINTSLFRIAQEVFEDTMDYLSNPTLRTRLATGVLIVLLIVLCYLNYTQRQRCHQSLRRLSQQFESLKTELHQWKNVNS